MNPLAAIHQGKKALRLDDAAYRDLLDRVTGKRSSAIMSRSELNRVVAEMRRMGFEPPPPKVRRMRLEGPFAAKCQALWIAAWNLGIVRQRDDEALAAFIERQTGISHSRWLRHPEDAKKVVEALKSMLAREGGVDWRRSRPPAAASSTPDAPSTGFAGPPPPQGGGGSEAPRHLNDPRYRIAVAQWRKLIALRAVTPFAPLVDPDDLGSLEHRYGDRVTGKAAFQFYVPADWIALMNALGGKLRRALQEREANAVAGAALPPEDVGSIGRALAKRGRRA